MSQCLHPLTDPICVAVRFFRGANGTSGTSLTLEVDDRAAQVVQVHTGVACITRSPTDAVTCFNDALQAIHADGFIPVTPADSDALSLPLFARAVERWAPECHLLRAPVRPIAEALFS